MIQSIVILNLNNQQIEDYHLNPAINIYTAYAFGHSCPIANLRISIIVTFPLCFTIPVGVAPGIFLQLTRYYSQVSFVFRLGLYEVQNILNFVYKKSYRVPRHLVCDKTLSFRDLIVRLLTSYTFGAAILALQWIVSFAIELICCVCFGGVRESMDARYDDYIIAKIL